MSKEKDKKPKDEQPEQESRKPDYPRLGRESFGRRYQRGW